MSEEEGARFGSTDVGSGAPDGAPGMSDAPRTCAWCGTPATPEATTCASCGAALAQRESIGDLAISGLTAVDAALQDFDKRPLRLRGPSPSQGMAPALIVGVMAGGPIGLAAIGGVAAVAAAEYLGASGGAGAALENVGKPSEVALRALEHLGPDAAKPSDSPGTTPAEAQDSSGAATDAADDGRSIWRDLPAIAQHEEGVADGR